MIKRSPIVRKHCKCNSTCDKYPSLGYSGYYSTHAPLEVLDRIGSNRQQSIRNRAKRSNLTRKLHIAQKMVNGDTAALELFFSERMNRLYPQCDNCFVTKPSLLFVDKKKQWRSCQAHLLPKRHFKSIQTHPLNCMVLGSGYSGMCYCHDDYDHDWERASKMKIWDEVVRRFKILYPLTIESERRFTPKILLDTL